MLTTDKQFLQRIEGIVKCNNLEIERDVKQTVGELNAKIRRLEEKCAYLEYKLYSNQSKVPIQPTKVSKSIPVPGDFWQSTNDKLAKELDALRVYAPKQTEEYLEADLPPEVEIKSAYYWVTTTVESNFPENAIEGGKDKDGAIIYVGRALHRGDWIPGKVMPEKQAAFIPYGGAEIYTERIQVLCQRHFEWVPARGGYVPPGAIPGGKTCDGDTLYIGRVNHDGVTLTVGKIHPSHQVCYISFNGKEIKCPEYEVLILRP